MGSSTNDCPDRCRSISYLLRVRLEIQSVGILSVKSRLILTNHSTTLLIDDQWPRIIFEKMSSFQFLDIFAPGRFPNICSVS